MGFSIGSIIGAAGNALTGGISGALTAGISSIFGGSSRGALPLGVPSGVRIRKGNHRGPGTVDPNVGPSSFIADPRGSRFLTQPDFPQVSQFGTFGLTRGTALAVQGAGALAMLFALSRERTGQPVNRKKVAAAVRHCGIGLAADLFQLSETEICRIVISRGRRRGRGISAADLRRTRSTIRKVKNISRDLASIKATRRR